MPYVGRFAPSPTGDLHLGSLYTAAASYLDARANGGRWLLRIEDLDRPREVAGCGDAHSPDARGLRLRMGRRRSCTADRSARRFMPRPSTDLRDRGLTFECSCSRLRRARLPRTARRATRAAAGHCGPHRSRRRADRDAPAGRSRHDSNSPIAFKALYRQDVAAVVGDVILKRRDSFIAYLLAVVVDDAAAGRHPRGARRRPSGQHAAADLPAAAARTADARVRARARAGGARRQPSSPSRRAACGWMPDSALPQLLRVFALLGLAPPRARPAATLAQAWAWAVVALGHRAHLPRRLDIARESAAGRSAA